MFAPAYPPSVWFRHTRLFSPRFPLRRFVPTPLPVPDLRQVLTVFINVLLMLDELVLELLLQVDALVAGLWQAIDGVHHEVKAGQVVQHRPVEGRGDGPP